MIMSTKFGTYINSVVSLQRAYAVQPLYKQQLMTYLNVSCPTPETPLQQPPLYNSQNSIPQQWPL